MRSVPVLRSICETSTESSSSGLHPCNTISRSRSCSCEKRVALWKYFVSSATLNGLMRLDLVLAFSPGCEISYIAGSDRGHWFPGEVNAERRKAGLQRRTVFFLSWCPATKVRNFSAASENLMGSIRSDSVLPSFAASHAADSTSCAALRFRWMATKPVSPVHVWPEILNR